MQTDTDHFRKDLLCVTGLLAIISDFSPPDDPVILPVTDRVSYTLRCYAISTVLEEDREKYRLMVIGQLNLG